MNADALILAAGLGTRLRPETLSTPKPLIKIAGEAIISRLLRRLSVEGFRRIFVNTHYLAAQMHRYLEDGSEWGVEILISHEPTILDTGGAIRQIGPRIGTDNLLIVNADLLMGDDFSFAQLLSEHRSRTAEATLLLRKDPEQSKFGEIGIDCNGRIEKFLGASSPSMARAAATQVKPGQKSADSLLELDYYMFCGVHVLRTEQIERMPSRGTPFSITRDWYQQLVANGEHLRGLTYSGYWNDIGTPERLKEARALLEGTNC